jgi:hypothetical protein
MSRHHTPSRELPSSVFFRFVYGVVALAGAFVIISGALTSVAQAAVEITIDKNTQRMSVAVNGEPRYTWPVSSGIPARETPNGTFKAFRMEADHYSKEWDDAPMPHSIFFTKVGHAIHGTDSVNRLGTPASHGCVRLSRENAATLYALVEREGVLNTTVTLTGSAQYALAHGIGRRAIARGDDVGQPVQLTPDDQVAPGQRYVDQYGNPVDRYGNPLSANRAPRYAGGGNSNHRIYQPPPQDDNQADNAGGYYAGPRPAYPGGYAGPRPPSPF